jgi:hypothetical protein
VTVLSMGPGVPRSTYVGARAYESTTHLPVRVRKLAQNHSKTTGMVAVTLDRSPGGWGDGRCSDQVGARNVMTSILRGLVRTPMVALVWMLLGVGVAVVPVAKESELEGAGCKEVGDVQRYLGKTRCDRAEQRDRDEREEAVRGKGKVNKRAGACLFFPHRVDSRSQSYTTLINTKGVSSVAEEAAYKPPA